MKIIKKIIDLLRRLGILKVGGEVNTYKSAKDSGYKIDPLEKHNR
ncbi:MAG: hypothetical protein N2482_01060 [Patescibacteria group bacterium]|nr:hypothetical protein [Patescibacteria group bacterium]